jgi:hypothetical protein
MTRNYEAPYTDTLLEAWREVGGTDEVLQEAVFGAVQAKERAAAGTLTLCLREENCHVILFKGHFVAQSASGWWTEKPSCLMSSVSERSALA